MQDFEHVPKTFVINTVSSNIYFFENEKYNTLIFENIFIFEMLCGMMSDKKASHT